VTALWIVESARRSLICNCHTGEDERRSEAELIALCDEAGATFNRITELPEATTLAGAAAMARAAMCQAPIERDGSLSPMDDAEWLAFGAPLFLAGAQEELVRPVP
jgi:hypothetical protein